MQLPDLPVLLPVQPEPAPVPGPSCADSCAASRSNPSEPEAVSLGIAENRPHKYFFRGLVQVPCPFFLEYILRRNTKVPSNQIWFSESVKSWFEKHLKAHGYVSSMTCS